MCTGLRFLWGCGVDGGASSLSVPFWLWSLSGPTTALSTQRKIPTHDFAHNMEKKEHGFGCTLQAWVWGLNEVARLKEAGSAHYYAMERQEVQSWRYHHLRTQMLVPRNKGNVLGPH